MKPLLLAVALLAHAAHADENVSAAVHTVAAKRGEMPALLVAHGTAAPSPGGTLVMSLPLDGRVSHILVTAGAPVQPGQALLSFETSPATLRSFAQADAALSLARTQQAHVATLFAQKLATRDQLAAADSTLNDARSQLDLLRHQQADQPTQTLTAPFAGVVASLSVSQGDRLAANTPMLTLTRDDGLVVTLGVEPAARAQVAAGQPVELTPLDGGAAMHGHVLRIDATLNPRTRMFDADIAVPNTAFSGEAFRAVITTGQLHGWLAPHAAVQIDAAGPHVFQITAGTAHRVPVTLLGMSGDIDVIDGPLVATAPLAVEGSYQLTDGMAVRVETAP